MEGTLTLEQALAYLGAIQPNGSDQKSLPLVKGRRARTVTKYIAGLSNALATNNGSTVLPATQKATGITNFEQGNILPKGTHLLVIGVRALFDTTAAVTPLTAIWANVAPPIWKNGELTILQDGQGVLFQSSGTDVTNFKASTGNDADFRECVPFLLRPDTTFDIVAKLAGAAAADQAYKIELRCIELIEGDKA